MCYHPSGSPGSTIAGRVATMRHAGALDHLILTLWCAMCFIAINSLLIYLPASVHTSMEELSEHPTLYTALTGLSAAGCLATVAATWRRPAFGGGLRGPLLAGTLASILGFAFYTSYVYVFSNTLPSSEAAPQVGQIAPDFAVTDPEGREWSLQAKRGSAVLVVFYRGHW